MDAGNKCSGIPGLTYRFFRAHSSRRDANFLNGAPGISEDADRIFLVFCGPMENDTNVTLLYISTRARRGMSNTKAVPAQCQLLVQ